MTKPLSPEVKARRAYERKQYADRQKNPQYYQRNSGWIEGNVKCSHCPRGWRHPVGNCVVCGCGPSPMHFSFWCERLPESDAEIDEALARLADGTTGVKRDYGYQPDYRGPNVNELIHSQVPPLT